MVSMVPAAPLLPTRLPARPAVVHGAVTDTVVVGEVEPLGELEDVVVDDPLVDVGDEVVVEDDDEDEQAPRTAPHSKPPATKRPPPHARSHVHSILRCSCWRLAAADRSGVLPAK